MGNGKWQILDGSRLKLIAVFTMVLDHVGVLLFTEVSIFRILGRLSYPIFAFMIAEGCRYTRNKLRHFLMIFAVGAVCQAVYCFVSERIVLNILLTFACSVLLIYALQSAYGAENEWKKALWATAFAAVFLGVYALGQLVVIDYGFWGVMTPVLVSFGMLLQLPHWGLVLILGVGLALLGTEYVSVQNYAFLALPLLLLYNGKPGKHRMKYFFYIFYPAHLAVLQGIVWLVR